MAKFKDCQSVKFVWKKKYILRLEFIRGDRRLSGVVKEVKLAPKPPVAPLLTAKYRKYSPVQKYSW